MPKLIQPAIIRPSAALTASYVVSNVVDCYDADYVTLMISYTMGTAETSNSLVFKAEWSLDTLTYFQEANPWPNQGAIAGGNVVIKQNEFTLKAVSAAATYDRIVLPYKVMGRYFRAWFKEIGKASNFGTCAALLQIVTER